MSRFSRSLTRLVSSGAGAASVGAAPLPRILCFGDSLTEGFTRRGTIMHPYARALARRLEGRAVVEESGISGELTGEMVPRLNAILEAAANANRPYTLAILLGGTNDVCHELPTEGAVKRVRAMHSACLTQCARTVALTLPELDAPVPGSFEAERGPRSIDLDIAAINKGIKDLTTDAEFVGRISLFDFFTACPQHGEATAPFWDPDAVHLTIAGYDWMGEQLANLIDDNQLLGEKTSPTTN